MERGAESFVINFTTFPLYEKNALLLSRKKQKKDKLWMSFVV